LIGLFRAIEFFFVEATVNIRRHGLMSLAAIAIIAFVFLLVGLFGLMLANVRSVTEYALNEVTFFAYLPPRASLDEAHALRMDILDLEGVKSARVITKEEAFERVAKKLGRGQNLGNIPNRLGHSVRVTAVDPRDVLRIADHVRGMPAVESIRDARESVSRLLEWARVVDVGVVVMGILLALAVLVIIHSAIRLTLFARRREISVMQMVGATSTYVAGPFLLEGAFHGTVGSVIAAGLLFLGYDYLLGRARDWTWLPLVSEQQVIWGFWGMIIAGFVLGVLGSLFSVRRFLDRPVVV